MENPVVGPYGLLDQSGLPKRLAFMVHNFVGISQISTKPIPIDSPGQDLSIGIGLVKI